MLSELRPHDEIILRMNINDVRKTSFIKYLDDSRIAVSQTVPEMDTSMIMSLIFFTYCPDKPQKERLGFQARIENITPDHQIIIRQLTRPFVCDLRLWPRILFNTLPNAQAYCDDRTVGVVDVSGGGTRLVLHKDDPDTPAAGSLVVIKFIFEDGETAADGKILNLWNDSKGMRHVEVKFIGNPEISDFIYKKR